QVSNEVITAGSAPAVAVAWFVGGGGLVLVTTDAGATFSDVSLAEPLDIASVSAADARIAAIFTVSGRRFRTQDGGRTWQPF
ncbi:MAG TPA: YCF48-related protein, partial [Vicinamibacterales bacterium]